jgi:esterase/lipase superfamily enzyme
MPLAEVYSALPNGQVDASENRIERTLAARQLKDLTGGTLVGGFRQPQGFFVSGESSWVALKERERAALREAAKQASSTARSVVVSIEAALPEDARNSGLRFAKFETLGGANVEANAAAQWLRTAGASGPQAITLLRKVKQTRPPALVPRSEAPGGDPVRPQIVFASVRNDEGGADLSNRFGIARDKSTKLTCGEVQFTSNNARQFGRPYAGAMALAGTSTRVSAQPCVDLVATASAQRGGRVVVFIHGYNNTFDTALRRAIGVGEDLKIDAPIVLWSWPSQGTESGYVYDTMSVEFSRPYFREFVSALLKNPKVKEITVMAHSMGSRIALQMLEQSAQAQRKLASIVFVAPDVPQTLFSQAIDLYGRGASLATMYANEHDRPLTLSEVVNREAPAGLAGNALFVSDGIETVDLSRLDFEWFGTNHSAGFEIPKAAADVSLVVNRHVKAASRSLNGVTLGKLTYWTIQP